MAGMANRTGVERGNARGGGPADAYDAVGGALYEVRDAYFPLRPTPAASSLRPWEPGSSSRF